MAARAKQLKSRRLDVKLDPGILQALVGEIIHERERRYQEVHHRGRQAPKPKPFEPKPGQARRITDAE